MAANPDLVVEGGLEAVVALVVVVGPVSVGGLAVVGPTC